MSNLKFCYLYRDAGNYKKWGEAVFTNPERITPEAAQSALREHLGADGLFIAQQIRVPNVFLFSEYPVNDDDHCFHEFVCIEATFEAATDECLRSFSQFVSEVSEQSTLGWSCFDPQEEVPSRGSASR